MEKVLIIFLLFFAFRVQAVVINEIAWMGTEASYNDEWIELYNPLESPVLLNGWTLETKDQGLMINLKGTISPKSYLLLERTDDTTLLDITADIIYKGGLNNQGEHLLLLNNNRKTIDEVDCSLGWFAGRNETKKSMERIDTGLRGSDPLNWKTSSEKEGTPRIQNSEEKEISEKQIASIPQDGNYSSFSFVLIPGIALSLFSSALAMSFLLKVKQKKNSIKDNTKI